MNVVVWNCTTTHGHCGTSGHCSHAMPQIWSDTVLCRLDWTMPTHCCTADRQPTSTVYRVCITHWPESSAKLHAQPVQPNYVSSFNGYQFTNASTSNWQSTPTRPQQRLLQPTCLTWSMTITLGRCLRSADKLTARSVPIPCTSLALSTKAFSISNPAVGSSLSH